jgi:ubiquinone/menaquinone biosynthesis C-methylase UbiE
MAVNLIGCGRLCGDQEGFSVTTAQRVTTAQIDWKEQAKAQWNNTPCDSQEGDTEELDYYLSVERKRYQDAPWIKELFRFDQYQGKKVLEIGFGQGTDLCQFALAGADCFGVDITQRHYELAQRNFELRNLKAQLFLEDASKLHFEDNTFDAVYSLGVLHHTPDTIRCISEAYRVLKRGGEFMLGLYHRDSAFHYASVLLTNGLLNGNLRRLGYDGLLATVEKGADGTNIKPLVKLYTPYQLRLMLSDFRQVSINIRHLERSHFSVLARFVPPSLVPSLEHKLGWYVIAHAQK